MITRILTACSFLLALNSSAQIYINPGVDTTLKEVRVALPFYNSYMSGFKNKAIPNMARYWPESELNLRKVPDQSIYMFDDYPLYSQGYNQTIIYVRPTDKYVKFKIQLSSVDSLKHMMTMSIFNYYVAFDKQHQPYFINPLTVNLANWHINKVRNVTYYYPPYYHFNIEKAARLIKQIMSLEKVWGLQPINIRYYLTTDNDELYKLVGFDYALTMGNKLKPSGKSDGIDNQVYCSGWGEDYFHEIVHLYLNHLYPKSPLQEGLAVFYGGSMGHDIKWHLKRVNKYLLDHPNIDLTDINNFWYTDPYTNPGSAIQGMICKMAYQKGGFNGLKQLMTYTSFNEIFKQEFGIDKSQINAFLRKTISEQFGGDL
jgi:hypothetical protein